VENNSASQCKVRSRKPFPYPWQSGKLAYSPSQAFVPKGIRKSGEFANRTAPVGKLAGGP
jgi:hypothetical protein